MKTAPPFPNDDRTLHVGIDAWIIQDGNYDDFRVGDALTCALYFHPRKLESTDNRTRSLKRLSASRYRVRGRVAFGNEDVTVLDFGWMAYAEGWRDKPQLRIDDWVNSELYVGVDPYSWVEIHRTLAGMPELRYDFRISSILRETTPWVNSPDPGIAKMRDPERESFISVDRTDAWHDDEGYAHYVVECELTWS